MLIYCDSVILIDDGTIIASGPPEQLRREASGGDIIDIEFSEPRPDIVVRLQSLPFVQDVKPLDRPGVIRVVVTEITDDLPHLQEFSDREQGGHVAMEPHTLSFDDVFVRLVSRARHAEKGHADGAAKHHA